MPATPGRAATTPRRRPTTSRPVGGFRTWVTQFLTLKDENAALASRMNDLKKRAMAHLEGNSQYTDDKGSQYIDFPTPIEVNGVTCTGVKREKRVSTVIDEESAIGFLKDRGLLNRVTKKVTVLDEDAIYGLLAEGAISEADLDTHVFRKNTTWAFVPLTSRAK